MTKHMLIDATHPEETRVVVVSGKRLEEFDAEIASKKALKGNIFLAKIVRVEPSLQAAFVDYGGNRHGFLAFNEIHPDYYRIPIADREALQAELEAEAAANERSEEDDDESEDSVHAKAEGAERVESEPVADDADLIDSTEGDGDTCRSSPRTRKHPKKATISASAPAPISTARLKSPPAKTG
jgi:ribonuclease E